MLAPRPLALLNTLVFMLVLAIALFGPAGRFDVLSFWLYIAVFAAICIAALMLVDPALAQERLAPGGRRPGAAQMLALLAILAHWMLAGLDHGRLHWSDGVALGMQIGALVAVAASLGFVTWAARENPFASSALRIQGERGHRVISTGPYALVRHPSYLAAMVLFVTSDIALGSWLATAWGSLFVPLLLRGTAKEDRFLVAELPGYADYTKRVPYRILPGVW
jgi:protein-S-isoprenylcysteine O-methyltransferase Ste14